MLIKFKELLLYILSPQSRKLLNLKKQFLKYYENTEDTEIQSIKLYMKNHVSIDMFNCNTSVDYQEMNVDVCSDDWGKCVDFKGTKIYFPPTYDYSSVKQEFVGLLREQDIFSPHRYLNDEDWAYINEYRQSGKIKIFDLGAQEGMFSSEFVNIASEINIFECETQWTNALARTFQGCDNVRIVQKYVADSTENNMIAIDDYCKNDDGKGLYIIKMDIEGAEIKALIGMHELLEKVDSFILLVCAYHNQEDETIIRGNLEKYEIKNTPGYVMFVTDKKYGEPYVRRGVIKIYKR